MINFNDTEDCLQWRANFLLCIVNNNQFCYQVDMNVNPRLFPFAENNCCNYLLLTIISLVYDTKVMDLLPKVIEVGKIIKKTTR